MSEQSTTSVSTAASVPRRQLAGIRWGRAFGGAFAAEAALIAAAFAWVAIYSYLVHPGEGEAFYQRYALRSAPWVSFVMGVPLFYLASRWIARNRPTALVLFGLYLLFDGTVLLMFAGTNPNLTVWGVAGGYLLKLLACLFGGRSASGR